MEPTSFELASLLSQFLWQFLFFVHDLDMDLDNLLQTILKDT